ncbi:hypothetical protein RAS1_12800 [Phycisphaerae bacterium RAS1]|nr:hypothetical protein RAS1_12800 [Phycisphaerae bacterium RAS1]
MSVRIAGLLIACFLLPAAAMGQNPGEDECWDVYDITESACAGCQSNACGFCIADQCQGATAYISCRKKRVAVPGTTYRTIGQSYFYCWWSYPCIPDIVGQCTYCVPDWEHPTSSESQAKVVGGLLPCIILP